ncbi:MAG: S8 family peptidase [Phycisphaerales bacterium]
MSNQQAIRDLLSLWEEWPNEWEGETEDGRPIRAPSGFGAFKDLFRYLTDVRHWGPQDRVQDTLLPWLSRLQIQSEQMIKFEVELWFRNDGARRNISVIEVSRIVEASGGGQLSECVVPEIRYHGVLMEAPAGTVKDITRQILNSDYGDLVRCEDVMFFRPGPQSVSVITDDEGEEGAAPEAGEAIDSTPTVALLDGLPLERHEALDGQLIIDDPDDFAASYRPGQQGHGTAMASLIVHGDLEDAVSVPLSRSVYVRPVLRPVEVLPGQYEERFPEDRLFVDVIHRAVRRIVEGDGDEAAVAPSVRIINLSLGNPWQVFDRNVSPLARLLDWLSWKYSLLFMVAAGNQGQPITVEKPEAEYTAFDDGQAVLEALRAMGGDQVNRRLYSPAESINSITVGALHVDACEGELAGRAVDILRGRRTASPLGTVASGFRRAVKPEILLPGGRQLYNQRIGAPNDSVEFDPVTAKTKPGHRVAAPSQLPGELSKYWYERGTSNATALATRWAAIILERLFELQREPGGDALQDELLHVATKTLLVHGASWGDLRDTIKAIAPDGAGWQQQRQLVARFLGYGCADLERSTIASDQRVLLIGCGTIEDGQGHVYNLPLPPSLSGITNRRRLTTTLAWVTPINTLHRDYRRAALFLNVPDAAGFSGTVEVHQQLATVGTVQHQVYETERAVPIDENTSLELKVNCREAAGNLDTAVPYALAVTLEVAHPIEADIHIEIREALRARALVR